jgi:hypothetical protein
LTHAIRLCSLPRLRQTGLRRRQALPELPRTDIVAQPPAETRFRRRDPCAIRNHRRLCRTTLNFGSRKRMFNNMLGKAALQTVSGPFLYREHENVTLRAKLNVTLRAKLNVTLRSKSNVTLRAKFMAAARNA